MLAHNKTKSGFLVTKQDLCWLDDKHILTSILINNFSYFVGIFGGHLLGIRSVSGLAFYDWESTDLIRRIEITPKNVSIFW